MNSTIAGISRRTKGWNYIICHCYIYRNCVQCNIKLRYTEYVDVDVAKYFEKAAKMIFIQRYNH